MGSVLAECNFIRCGNILLEVDYENLKVHIELWDAFYSMFVNLLLKQLMNSNI